MRLFRLLISYCGDPRGNFAIVAKKLLLIAEKCRSSPQICDQEIVHNCKAFESKCPSNFVHKRPRLFGTIIIVAE